MFDEGRVARIGQDLGQRLGQAQPTIQLAQERQTAIAGHVAARKAGGKNALFYGWKVEEFGVTNCARRSGGFRIHFNPIDIGPRSPLRLFSMKFLG